MPKNLYIRNLHGSLRTELDTAITGNAFIADVKFRFQDKGVRRAVEGAIAAGDAFPRVSFRLDFKARLHHPMRIEPPELGQCFFIQARRVKRNRHLEVGDRD